MDKRTCLVKHLPYALTAALERLIKKHPEQHGFVIVSDDLTDRFVQFANTKGELLYDVPALGIVIEPCTDVAHGVARAVTTIDYWLLGPDATLSLVEDDFDNGPRKRLAKWWKKLKESLAATSEA